MEVRKASRVVVMAVVVVELPELVVEEVVDDELMQLRFVREDVFGDATQVLEFRLLLSMKSCYHLYANALRAFDTACS